MEERNGRYLNEKDPMGGGEKRPPIGKLTPCGVKWELHKMATRWPTAQRKTFFRWTIIAEPLFPSLSCNCQRARPPYGGLAIHLHRMPPYTDFPISAMDKLAKQLHPPTPHQRAKGQTVEGPSNTNLEPTKREAAPDTLFSPGDIAKATRRHLSPVSHQ